MATITLTDQDFAATIAGDTPVLVDFWAEWCGPCKMIGPSLEALSDEMAGRVRIAKVNIDDNPDSPARYGVRGIPAMLLFRNGELVAQKVGAAPKGAIQQWLEGELAK